MTDASKTKAQLIEELTALRQRAAEWETSEAQRKSTGTLILQGNVTEKVWQQQWEASLHRIREALWEMSRSKDIRQMLQVLYQKVKKHIPQVDGCSVQMIDETTGEWESYQISEREITERLGPLPGEAVKVCWREQQPVYRPNLQEEDPYEEAALMWDPKKSYSPAVRAVVDVPFRQGTLAINSTQPKAFSEEHIELLQEMTQVLSEGYARMRNLVVLEQRHRELEEKERLLTAYHQMGQIILSSLDRDEILDHLAQEIVHAGIFRSLIIALVHEEERLVRVVRNYVCVDEDGRILPQGTTRSLADRGREFTLLQDEKAVGFTESLDSDELTARTARTGELLVRSGYGHDLKEREGFSGEGEKVAYFIPVKKDGRVLAVLGTGSRPEDEAVMRHRIEVMQPLLDQVAIALNHAQLYQELQREQAIERMRYQVRSMQEPEEWEGILHLLDEVLTHCGVAFQACGVNLVNLPDRTMQMYTFNDHRQEERDFQGPLVPVIEAVVRENRTLYRPDTWVPGEWEEGFIPPESGMERRSVVDVPFVGGTVAMSDPQPNAFSQRDLETLEKIAAVISEGYQRYLDITARQRMEQELIRVERLRALVLLC